KLTVFLKFDGRIRRAERMQVIRKLKSAVAAGDIANPRWHTLGLLASGKHHNGRQVIEAIDLARECRLKEVAVAGLLCGMPPEELDQLLRHATKQGVRLRSRMQVDPQTTARHVWTGLSVARNMGLELGKYGLVPLSIEEQRDVIARIQYWFPSWCAAPVCYI